jgi:hypothetical protein
MYGTTRTVPVSSTRLFEAITRDADVWTDIPRLCRQQVCTPQLGVYRQISELHLKEMQGIPIPPQFLPTPPITFEDAPLL